MNAMIGGWESLLQYNQPGILWRLDIVMVLRILKVASLSDSREVGLWTYFRYNFTQSLEGCTKKCQELD